MVNDTATQEGKDTSGKYDEETKEQQAADERTSARKARFKNRSSEQNTIII